MDMCFGTFNGCLKRNLSRDLFYTLLLSHRMIDDTVPCSIRHALRDDQQVIDRDTNDLRLISFVHAQKIENLPVVADFKVDDLPLFACVPVLDVELLDVDLMRHLADS